MTLTIRLLEDQLGIYYKPLPAGTVLEVDVVTPVNGPRLAMIDGLFGLPQEYDERKLWRELTPLELLARHG